MVDVAVGTTPFSKRFLSMGNSSKFMVGGVVPTSPIANNTNSHRIALYSVRHISFLGTSI